MLRLPMMAALLSAGLLVQMEAEPNPAERQTPSSDRIILQTGFDSGEDGKPPKGDFIIATNPPSGAVGSAARGVPRRGDGHQMIVLRIAPPRPVGALTQLRFRYHLTGASELTVQIFDATVQDNRHIRLRNLKQNQWATLSVDFTRDSRRNDGTPNSDFEAGNLVDDLFFFVEGEGAKVAMLHLDEVVLYDANENKGN